MANEINIQLDSFLETGLTVVAKVFNKTGTQQGTDISLTETSAGFYSGDFNLSTLSDGDYVVKFQTTTEHYGSGLLSVKGGVEAISPTKEEFDSAVAGLSTFNATTDTVTTDLASREASKADVSGLATQASVDNLQTSVNAIPTTDSVADLTPVLTAIASLNDPTPAEIRAAFNAIDFKDKNTELEIHTWLDSYLNKDDWKGGGGTSTVDLTPVIDLINGLNDFDPATDVVARVTLVDTTTTNTDMRGTDGANTTAPDNTAIAAIKERTDNLPDDPASNAKVEESAFL